MSIFDRLRTGDADDRVVVRSPRHRKKLIRTIEDAIVDLETSGAPALEVQPLIQVVGPASYPAWREAWEKSWRKKQVPYSTASWPERIQTNETAALLVPVSAGRVGTALGKHPRPIAEPTFLVGPVPEAAGPEDPALAVTAQWFGHLARPGTISAPPVVEMIVDGRVARRWVAEFGIAWSLPAADGV